MAKRRPDAVMTASRAVQRRAEDLLFGHGRAIFDKKKGVATIRRRSAIKNLAAAGQKKTEVLVKISNARKKTDLHKSAHIHAHLNYISRHGKIKLTQKDGSVQIGQKATATILNQWKKQGLVSEQSKYKQTLNIVFSAKQGATPAQIEKAVVETANILFEKNDWAFAVHTDTNNPHVHLCVTMRDYEGKRLNPRKNDLFLWRTTFADRLQALGVECTATKRIHRGLLPDTTPQSFYPMREREAIIDKQQKKYDEMQALINDGKKNDSAFNDVLKNAHNPNLAKQIQNQQALAKGYKNLARSLYLEGKKTEAKALSQLAQQVQNSTIETQDQQLIKQLIATGNAPKPYAVNQLYKKAESHIDDIDAFLKDYTPNEQQAKAIARRLYQKGFKTQARKVSTWSKNHIQDKSNTL